MQLEDFNTLLSIFAKICLVNSGLFQFLKLSKWKVGKRIWEMKPSQGQPYENNIFDQGQQCVWNINF